MDLKKVKEWEKRELAKIEERKKKKYLLIGEHIYSKNDDDVHYISSGRLLGLYGLDRAECVLVDKGQYYSSLHTMHLMALRPRYDGDYKEHLKWAKEFYDKD